MVESVGKWETVREKRGKERNEKRKIEREKLVLSEILLIITTELNALYL